MDIIKYDKSLPELKHSYGGVKIDVLFGGQVPEEKFQEKAEHTRDIVSKLTSKNLPIKNNLHKWKDVWTDFIVMNSGDAEMRIKLGATPYNPSKFYKSTWGYSLQIFFRGRENSVEEGFDLAIEKLGFPKQVELAPKFPRLYGMLGLYKLFDIDIGEVPNAKGWEIAKKVIHKHGAELKTVHYSICEFPYNLLIRNYEGRIFDSNMRILGDDSAEKFMKNFYVRD